MTPFYIFWVFLSLTLPFFTFRGRVSQSLHYVCSTDTPSGPYHLPPFRLEMVTGRPTGVFRYIKETWGQGLDTKWSKVTSNLLYFQSHGGPVSGTVPDGVTLVTRTGRGTRSFTGTMKEVEVSVFLTSISPPGPPVLRRGVSFGLTNMLVPVRPLSKDYKCLVVGPHPHPYPPPLPPGTPVRGSTQELLLRVQGREDGDEALYSSSPGQVGGVGRVPCGVVGVAYPERTEGREWDCSEGKEGVDERVERQARYRGG